MSHVDTHGTRAATDIVVLGAGPAGSAAALMLSRHAGHRVHLVEGTRFEAARIGESVTGAMRALVDHIDAGAALARADCSIPSYTAQAEWGSVHVSTQDSLMTAHGDGRLLDRRRFDEALAALAESRGATTWRETWLRDVERVGGVDAAAWRLAFDHRGETRRIEARFVIDATGRRAAFARRAGASVHAFDDLVAVASHVDRPRDREMPHGVLVESTADGWWYTAPLPRDRAVVAFLTDADLLASSRAAAPEHFRSRLAATTAVRERLAGCSPPGRPRVHLARTQWLDMPRGEGWVAAGDAAFAPDPLSSAGIGHALASGIQAARIADEALRGGDALSRAYPGDVTRNVERFLAQRTAVYASEGRWPDAPFWRRRRGGLPPAMSTDPGVRAQANAEAIASA